MIARIEPTHSTRLHVECVCDDGGSYCIEAKHCVGDLVLPNNVVDVLVTCLESGVRLAVTLIEPELNFEHSAEAVVV